MNSVSNNFFQILFNASLFGLKMTLLLWFVGCGSTTKLNSSHAISCFNEYPNKEVFDNYMTFHREHAERDQNSMRLLGCGYYQLGDLVLAEEWLGKAYSLGYSDIAFDLIAIYLKEGQTNLVSHWKGEVERSQIPETEIYRWLKIIESLEIYSKNNHNLVYLENALESIADKIKNEGVTPETENFKSSIASLIEIEKACLNNSETCTLPNLHEKRSYMKILYEGMLATMIPDLPLHWGINDYEETQNNRLLLTSSGS